MLQLMLFFISFFFILIFLDLCVYSLLKQEENELYNQLSVLFIIERGSTRLLYNFIDMQETLQLC